MYLILHTVKGHATVYCEILHQKTFLLIASQKMKKRRCENFQMFISFSSPAYFFSIVIYIHTAMHTVYKLYIKVATERTEYGVKVNLNV